MRRTELYEAGLYFILRERDRGWSGPRSTEKITAADIGGISRWFVVRMLAHQFNKSPRAVAYDLVDTYRALEHGGDAP